MIPPDSKATTQTRGARTVAACAQARHAMNLTTVWKAVLAGNRIVKLTQSQASLPAVAEKTPPPVISAMPLAKQPSTAIFLSDSLATSIAGFVTGGVVA